MINFLWLSTAFIAIFIIGEILLRKRYLPAESTRLITHIASGVLAAYLYLWLSRSEIFLLTGTFLILLAISKYKSFFRGIHDVKRKTYGEFFFPFGVAAAAYFFLPNNLAWYQLSLLTLALADPAANIFGSLVKTKMIRDKSIGGFVAFAITSIIIALFFISPLKATYYAILLATVETMSPLGSDNLTIVLGAQLVVLLLIT